MIPVKLPLFSVAGCAAVCAAVGSPVQEDKVSPQKPNVVIFFTDDQGSVDINKFGATDLYTPNLDRLCETGIMMTRFYASSSISSPSRASLMTGRYPQRSGLESLPPPDPARIGLPSSEITIAKVLSDSGYTTALVGKWHLGYHPSSLPAAHGFDYSFGHLGGCIDNYSHYFYWNGPNRHDLYENGREIWRDGENFADLMTERSLWFIEENRDKPFFLYFSSNYPHYPLQGDSKWREYYKDMAHPRDKYAAMVSSVDERIGIVIDKIEELGLRENTIIIFMSDNGHSTEERTFGGGGSAGIYKGEKFSVYEGGIRVPAIISYPLRLRTGHVCNETGIGMDWFPTILDLCDIDIPPHKLDGISLLSVLEQGQKSGHKILHWKVGNRWAVLKGDYKLVSLPGRDDNKGRLYELYDMSSDPAERTDIKADHPEIVNDLITEHHKWIKEVSSN